MTQTLSQHEGPAVIAPAKQFRLLLDQALSLADSNEFPPEIGARLQEVIDVADQLIGDEGDD
jgi:hypothetical protein